MTNHQGQAQEPFECGLVCHAPGVPTATGQTTDGAAAHAGKLRLDPSAVYTHWAPSEDVTRTDKSSGGVP
jgi:hypothetical protein